MNPPTRSSPPLVTIIVPVYNAAAYLRTTVDSILAQDHSRLQVVLVDDGSQDASGGICDELATHDARVQVVHQPNAGIAAAQNAGLDLARGEFVTFCDNDDLMVPHLVSRLVEIAVDSAADMSCCRWTNPGAGGASAELARLTAAPTGTYEVIVDPARAYQTVFPLSLRRMTGQELRYFSEANWGKLYRRELFDDIRFPTGRFAQDVAVAMDLYLRMERVASCSDELYLWLQHGESVSHSVRSTAYYSDIVAAHALSFERAVEAGILPARANYGLGALRDERHSIRTDGDHAQYDSDVRLVRSLRARLSPWQRLLCAAMGVVRRCEVVVYDRTVHRRQ